MKRMTIIREGVIFVELNSDSENHLTFCCKETVVRKEYPNENQ
jgi:hypothetical protein